MSELRKHVGQFAMTLMDEIADDPDTASIDMIVSYPVGPVTPWRHERIHRVTARWVNGELSIGSRSTTESASHGI